MINVDILENGTLLVLEKTVSDSVKFEKIRFAFPESWDGFSKTVVFKNEDAVVEVLLNTNSAYCTGEDECLVPFEVIKSPAFTISVFGLEGDRVATTVRGEIEVLESGYEQGDSPEEPTQSIYAQILDETQKAVRTAQSVRDDADSGKFKGDKGEKGETGEKGEKGEKGDSGKDALTDQTYNPRSKNAQSGQAVAEALLSIQTDENGNSIIVDQTFNPESENAQSGKAVDEAIKIQALNSKLAEALKEQNKSGSFTVWVGTQEEYDAINQKVQDCFYIVTDDNSRNEIIAETKESLGDYITEQGVYGTLTFRKWKSGVREIWGHTTLRFKDARCLSNTVILPFAFSDLPVVNLNMINGESNANTQGGIALSSTYTPDLKNMILSLVKNEGGYESDDTVVVGFHIMGKMQGGN